MNYKISNIKNLYMSLSLFKQRVIFYLLYTITFFVCFYLAYMPFELHNKSFIWKLDGAPVLYPAFEYAGSLLRNTIHNLLDTGNLSLQQFDFNLGLGQDILSYLGSWYLDPVSLLRMLVSTENSEAFYNFLVVIRYYLVGISFSLFAFHKKQNAFPTLLGTISYVFSYYTLYTGIKFPVFLMPMIYLPIMFIGMDKLIKQKKPHLLIFMVFLSAWTHYYFFVINTLFLGIYFIIEFILNSWQDTVPLKKKIERFFKDGFSIFCVYLTGTLMAAIVLIPNLLIFINSSRTASTINTGSLFWYGNLYFKNLWLYFSFPIPSFSIGYEACLGFLPIATLSIIAIFFQCKKFKRLTLYILLSLGALIFPICSYVLCGFSNINNRWIYGLVLVLSYGFCRIIPYLRSLSSKAKTAMIIYIILYGISIFTFMYKDRNEYTLVQMVLLTVSLLIIFYASNLKKTIFKFGIWAVTVCSIAIFGYYLNAPTQINYIGQFVDKGRIRDIIIDSPSRLMGAVDDDNFFRQDTIEPARASLSSSILIGYNGISSYSNVFDTFLYNYLIGVENAGLQENIMNYDLDGRTYLEAIASVKYISCSADMNSYIPFGYSKILDSFSDSYDNIELYENEYALPLGYTYSNYILEQDYAKLNPFSKQEAMLNSVVLEKEMDSMQPQSPDAMEYSNSQIEFTVSELKNIERDKKQYVVKEGGGSITLSFKGKPNTETYLRFENIDVSENEFLDWTWYIDNGTDSLKSLFLMNKKNYYHPDTNNFTVNLGYHKSATNTCKIYIPTEGTFTMNELQVWSQGFENYKDEIEGLSEDVLENITETGDYVSGEVDLSTDKILCLSIPYSPGWSAVVDGEKVDILRANVTYMAIPLTAGQHKIELYYHIPGLKIGAMFTGATCLLFISSLIYLKIKKDRRQKHL